MTFWRHTYVSFTDIAKLYQNYAQLDFTSSSTNLHVIFSTSANPPITVICRQVPWSMASQTAVGLVSISGGLVASAEQSFPMKFASQTQTPNRVWIQQCQTWGLCPGIPTGSYKKRGTTFCGKLDSQLPLPVRSFKDPPGPYCQNLSPRI